MSAKLQRLTMRLRSAEGESMAWAIVVAVPCKGALALCLASADCRKCVTFSCSAAAPPAAAADAGPSSCFSALLTAAPTSSAYLISKDLQEAWRVSQDSSLSFHPHHQDPREAPTWLRNKDLSSNKA